MKKRFGMEGTATLIMSDNEYVLKIGIYLQENKYFQLIGIADKSISNTQIRKKDIINVAFKEIILKDFYGTIYRNAFEKNIFITKIEENNTKFTFSFRDSYINLHKENDYFDSICYNNFVMQTHILEITYKGILIQQHPLMNSLISITSEKNKKIEKKILENIVTSLELLQGQSLIKFSENCFGDVKVYIGERKSITLNSDSILSDYLFINSYLSKVLNFLDEIPEAKRKKWLRAFRLLISYKRNQNTDLLIRLLQFFEIFKNKKTYKEALIKEFSIPKNEADFIKKIRNDLVHESLFIDESIEKNLAIVVAEESKLKNLLSITNDINKRSLIFAFYIEEIITVYINKNLFEDSYDRKVENYMKNFSFIYLQLV
ncbi:hypothetical protein [Fusobacterium varium]